MVLGSKIDELMRYNKKLKEEKATFVEANEKLIICNREREVEIRHFKAAIDSFSRLFVSSERKTPECREDQRGGYSICP